LAGEAPLQAPCPRHPVGDDEAQRDPVADPAEPVELAQRLGLRVVAEGVEMPVALERLALTGCEEVQGFCLQRPVPAEELPRWLTDWNSASELADAPQEEESETLLGASSRVLGEQGPLTQLADA
jgi:hypothetical protein